MSASKEGVYEAGIVDPGVPVMDSTQSFWTSSPHPLSQHKSPWPQAVSDIAIIGSGISGTSLAYHLLADNPALNITLVEARSLCSGATARNGGHIKTMSFAVWEHHKQAFGVEEAIRIAAFEQSHLESMTAVIKENSLDCDLVGTQGIDAYYDQKTFDRAVAALEDMRKHAPNLAAKYTVLDDRHALQRDLNLSPRCVGVISVPAASVWPYKMVTGLLASMIESGRLNVQTDTIVEAIREEPGEDFATISTSRGSIKAKQVVHATNGWMGHLIPELRPFISPVRGNVVRYGPVATAEVSGSPHDTSPLRLNSNYSYWLRYAEKDYDYLIQRKGGDIVVGRANTGRKATGDDSQTDLPPMAHLYGFGSHVVSSAVPDPSAIITHAWSGILGFTQDSMPFVGSLRRFPGRQRQWACGGYHGIGMVKAWRSGELMAGMLLGKEIGEECPRSMLISDVRMDALEESLGVKAKL
ncbi:FAD dependent oxidoreductase [Plectosphaerella plurivora]|uniref:FAD dependent oxidoreductase n=1 Tax=Plectosphaerella plurivora TaxID=936078 RepID=A0A9P9ADQ6_9PEZI|nr:FAD dependent oxidoreductase [Plectosphaerella plurivora]